MIYPYNCKICNRSLKDKHSLKFHLKKWHAISVVHYKDIYCTDILDKQVLLNEISKHGGTITRLIEYHTSIYFHTKIYDKYNASLQERVFVLKNNILDRPPCIVCGEKVNFYNHKGYASYCSTRCVQLDETINNKKIKTTMKNYGVEHALQNKKIIKKIQNTNMKKYGCKTPFQNEEVKQKIKNTNLERYGYENPFSNTENLKKVWLEKYGVDNPRKSEIVKKQIRDTLNERYGVINGYQVTDSAYSKISQELFWVIYNKLSNKIKQATYFAELNHEYHNYNNTIKKAYSFDLVILNIKLCIEFHGDIWHGNPSLYKAEDTPIPFKKDIKAKDLWERDKIKETFIKKLGFKYIVIWEDSFNKNKELVINGLLSKIERRIIWAKNKKII